MASGSASASACASGEGGADWMEMAGVRVGGVETSVAVVVVVMVVGRRSCALLRGVTVVEARGMGISEVEVDSGKLVFSTVVVMVVERLIVMVVSASLGGGTEGANVAGMGSLNGTVVVGVSEDIWRVRVPPGGMDGLDVADSMGMVTDSTGGMVAAIGSVVVTGRGISVGSCSVVIVMEVDAIAFVQVVLFVAN